MRINQNISAMNAWRNLSHTDNALSKSLERLSSGLRINRASDDAAGLAISEKMRGQVRGLNQAVRNSQDAISLIQTAEGGLNETHAILQRARELAVQAASDTLTADDRQEIQQEIDELIEEMDRIATTTEFNTKRLLDGSAGQSVRVGDSSVIGNASITGELNVDSVTTFGVDVTGLGSQQILTADGTSILDGDGGAAGTVNATDTLTSLLDGTDPGIGADTKLVLSQGDKSIAVELVGTDTVSQFIEKVNSQAVEAGMEMRMHFDSGIVIDSNVVGSEGDVYVNEVGFLNDATFGFAESQASGDATVAITDPTTGETLTAGTDYTVSGNRIIGVEGESLQGIEFTALAVNNTTLELDPTGGMVFHIGANENQNLAFNVGDLRSAALGVGGINVTTQVDADTSIGVLDTAIGQVSTERAKLGALQNRLEHTINNLRVAAENLAAAESRIRDVDMASEMMEFTRNQILTQAGTAMMAQANMRPQSVLQLLG